MSWLPAPKTLWGLVTSQESRDHVTPTLLNVNSLNWIRFSLVGLSVIIMHSIYSIGPLISIHQRDLIRINFKSLIKYTKMGHMIYLKGDR